jgi:hypothetical protein
MSLVGVDQDYQVVSESRVRPSFRRQSRFARQPRRIREALRDQGADTDIRRELQEALETGGRLNRPLSPAGGCEY